MHLNFPNFLSLLRIALIPVFVVLFVLPDDAGRIAAAAIFAIASFTDWLDGYLARKWEQASSFGAFLDPVADKLVVVTALVLLVSDNPSLWIVIPAIVIIGREITISALREWMAERNQRAQVAVSMIGKAKTMAQMLAIVLLVYQAPVAGLPVEMIGLVLLQVATVLTVWSMVVYLYAAWSAVRGK